MSSLLRLKHLQEELVGHLTAQSSIPPRQGVRVERRVVECIRAMAELIAYGEQSDDPRYFELFCELGGLQHLVEVVTTRQLACGPAVKTQVIQAVAIMVQNIKSVTSLFLLLSNNHINHLIAGGGGALPLHDEEFASHYVAFLKAISVRIGPETVQFLLDVRSGAFPLYHRALSLINHADPLVRTSALTMTLHVVRVGAIDAGVRDFLTREANLAPFLEELALLLRETYSQLLVRVLHVWQLDGGDGGGGRADDAEATQALEAVRGNVAALQDLVYYLQDLADVAAGPLRRRLAQSVVSGFVGPVLLGTLRDPWPATAAAIELCAAATGGASAVAATAAGAAAAASDKAAATDDRSRIASAGDKLDLECTAALQLALFILTQLFLVLSCPPLLAAIAEALLDDEGSRIGSDVPQAAAGASGVAAPPLSSGDFAGSELPSLTRVVARAAFFRCLLQRGSDQVRLGALTLLRAVLGNNNNASWTENEATGPIRGSIWGMGYAPKGYAPKSAGSLSDDDNGTLARGGGEGDEGSGRRKEAALEEPPSHANGAPTPIGFAIASEPSTVSAAILRVLGDHPCLRTVTLLQASAAAAEVLRVLPLARSSRCNAGLASTDVVSAPSVALSLAGRQLRQQRGQLSREEIVLLRQARGAAATALLEEVLRLGAARVVAWWSAVVAALARDACFLPQALDIASYAGGLGLLLPLGSGWRQVPLLLRLAAPGAEKEEEEGVKRRMQAYLAVRSLCYEFGADALPANAAAAPAATGASNATVAAAPAAAVAAAATAGAAAAAAAPLAGVGVTASAAGEVEQIEPAAPRPAFVVAIDEEVAKLADPTSYCAAPDPDARQRRPGPASLSPGPKGRRGSGGSSGSSGGSGARARSRSPLPPVKAIRGLTLPLGGRRCVACRLPAGWQAPGNGPGDWSEGLYVVFDETQLLLATPDKRDRSLGAVLCAAPVLRTTADVHTADARVLEMTTSSSSGSSGSGGAAAAAAAAAALGPGLFVPLPGERRRREAAADERGAHIDQEQLWHLLLVFETAKACTLVRDHVEKARDSLVSRKVVALAEILQGDKAVAAAAAAASYVIKEESTPAAEGEAPAKRAGAAVAEAAVAEAAAAERAAAEAAAAEAAEAAAGEAAAAEAAAAEAAEAAAADAAPEGLAATARERDSPVGSELAVDASAADAVAGEGLATAVAEATAAAGKEASAAALAGSVGRTAATLPVTKELPDSQMMRAMPPPATGEIAESASAAPFEQASSLAPPLQLHEAVPLSDVEALSIPSQAPVDTEVPAGEDEGAKEEAGGVLNGSEKPLPPVNRELEAGQLHPEDS